VLGEMMVPRAVARGETVAPRRANSWEP
jgi:hypothetical protein